MLKPSQPRSISQDLMPTLRDYSVVLAGAHRFGMSTGTPSLLPEAHTKFNCYQESTSNDTRGVPLPTMLQLHRKLSLVN